MLEISRGDVEREFIVEYPRDTRFIKLPIENYLKLLPAVDPLSGKTVSMFDTINRPQIALINAVNAPQYRFVCAALSRRLGKTFISNIIGQLILLIPNCNILIISPNYNLSSISFDLQRKLIKQFDLEITRDNLKDKIIELSNGSTIRMGSISQVDSCVGRSYDLIIFDEAALGSDGEEAFNVALRPTLDKVNSKAIFISTPRGKNNWFSKFFRRGYSDETSEWVSIHADYTENTRMSSKDVDEARKTMSAAEFEQEYMASFVTYVGRIYNFSDTNVINDLPQENGEILAGLDPGYKDATAFIVIKYVYNEDCFYVVDEYVKSEAVTKVHAEAFNEFISKWGIETIFIDHAAAQFAADLAYQYDIATVKAKKQRLEGIAYVQTIVETGRLKVMSHCEHTLTGLDQYRWDDRDTIQQERPIHDEHSHIMDALRYALYSYVI